MSSFSSHVIWAVSYKKALFIHKRRNACAQGWVRARMSSEGTEVGNYGVITLLAFVLDKQETFICCWCLSPIGKPQKKPIGEQPDVSNTDLPYGK